MSAALATAVLLATPNEEGHAAGNAPAELILVALLVLVFWGAFRIMGKKRS